MILYYLSNYINTAKPEKVLAFSGFGELKVFIPQCINCVFPADFAHGVQHGDKYDQKHAADRNGNAVPGDEEVDFQSLPDGVVDHPGHGKGDRKAIQQPLETVKEAFKVHHF